LFSFAAFTNLDAQEKGLSREKYLEIEKAVPSPKNGHRKPLKTREYPARKNQLQKTPACSILFLRLLLLYRLWVVKRSQGHTCGLFFCPIYRFAVFRAKLEDGRGSVEGLGTWGIR
jgi:hypothetical protein